MAKKDPKKQEQRKEPKPPPPNPGTRVKGSEPPTVTSKGTGRLAEGGKER